MEQSRNKVEHGFSEVKLGHDLGIPREQLALIPVPSPVSYDPP